MGATLAEIRAGLETRLATIPGVDVHAYMQESPNDLCLQVMGPDAIEYDQTMRRSGYDRFVFIVQGFSGSPDSRAAQENLDTWLAPFGANSVKAAIEGDRSSSGALGGIVDDVWVNHSSGYRHYMVGPTNGTKYEMLGAEWTVQINNRGT